MQKLLVQKGSTFIAALVFGFFAIGFLCWSAYQGLALRFEPWGAALITGLALAFIAFLIFQIGNSLSLSHSTSKPHLALRPGEVASKVEHELDGLVGPQIARMVSRNAKSATIAAIGLGLAAGRSKEMRKTLMQLMQEIGKDEPR